MMPIAPPFDLHGWIEQNRALLVPPVGNKLLFEDGAFIVMAVGGPNSRKDFHHDPSEEFFFQVEGEMLLNTVQDGRVTGIPIRQGEVFMLPAEVPHSPQRPAGSVGIVIERRRNPHELDGFSWYCERCGQCLYLERVAVRNIETQLPEIFSRFYSSVSRRTCSACGNVMQAPDT
jgi:3-hydroxyanthranilate 3,4-dioxygenase